MSNIEEVKQKILKFVRERDWEQFHKPKDMAISIALEAGELLEHFQWKNESDVANYIKIKENKEEISDEMADTFIYLLEMAHNLEIDLLEATEKKMAKNEIKYPVERSKGDNRKYNKFD